MSVKRGKDWGYEVEVQVLEPLRRLSPAFRRTGASSQKDADTPDIVLDGDLTRHREAMLLVATKDKGRGNPVLMSLALEDFIALVATGMPNPGVPVYVSVKGRKGTWLGGLYQKLQDWARRNTPPVHESRPMIRGARQPEVPGL